MEKIERKLALLEAQALADLKRLVDINSFSENINGLVKAGQVITEIAEKNGLQLEKHFTENDQKGAYHLISDQSNGKEFYGVIGHFDTVHPPNCPFQKFTDGGETLIGPGVQDMKSGIITALYGIKIAQEILGCNDLPIKIVFNCDEEIGSKDSRSLIETMMQGAEAAFIFEGRRVSDNALVTSRKGIMMGDLTIEGIEAHAGEAPQDGANAIVEAAHKIAAMDSLTNLEEGIVVTTGKISGGVAANQTAGYCSSTIDIRFRTVNQEEMLRDAIKKIMTTTQIRGCKLDYSLNTVRPPFTPNSATEKLRQLYTSTAAQFGLQISEREAGGGSDGNITAAMGVPTIDGIGPAGDFPHTDREFINKTSFFDAIKVFALLLTKTLKSKP